MKRHLLTILMTFVAAVISGTVFMVALFHQFALVEIAASILTGLQVFFHELGDRRLARRKEGAEPGKEFSGCIGDDFPRGVLFRDAILTLKPNSEIVVAGSSERCGAPTPVRCP